MRLFKKKSEKKKGIWRRVVDLALTDVRVMVGGIDHDTLETLEERLLTADFGVQATMRIMDQVETHARRGRAFGSEELRRAVADEVREILSADDGAELTTAESGPTVYLMVGVNGVGKTTTVGKLAHEARSQGRSVLMAAADTYRAGAVRQLEEWAERVGADFVGGQQGGDPAAVAFDALEAGVARGVDLILIDTAGRLQTNRGLMEELTKVDRVIRRKLPGAPHETLMVLDATVGQNALSQLRAFREAVEPTGIILAKMDSSAKGGIVVAIREEFGTPVKLIGVGETVDDLEPFDAEEFVEAVLTPAG